MGGALDSRFTFSRTTNATYINSSGYVAYNISNLFFNTAWTSTSLPTGWSEGINTAGTFTYNGNGTITLSAVSGRAVLVPASPYTATLTGVSFTISFTVTAVSGSPTLGEVITCNAGTDTYTINGVTKTSAQEVFANDLITCTSTATTTAHVVRIGIGVSGSVTGTKSVTVKNPQANIGATAQPYIANASTTTAYYAPRFDYNPTTLAPNGLLIEGQTTNLTKRSDNAFTNNLYWETTASNVDAADSAVTSPTGVASTASTLTERYALGASVSRHIHQLTGEFTPTVATSYTMSAWVKQPTSAAVRYVQFAFWIAGFGATAYMNYDIQTGVVGTGGAAITASTITAYPNGWYRITATAPATATGSSGFQLGFSTTSGAARTEAYVITSGSEKAIYLWGAQVEAGVGASSYIPTVASQVTRAADECYIADISGFNYSTTNGTIATQLVYTKQATGYTEQIGFMTAGDQPTIEIYLNPNVALYTSVRGSSLNTGGANECGSTITLNTLIKYAVSVDTVTDPIVKTNTNGVATSANKSGTGNMYTATRFVFGRLPASGYGASYGCLTIKSVKYWNTTKTAAELVALTA